MKKVLLAILFTCAADFATTEIYLDARSLVVPKKGHFLPKCLKPGEEPALWLKDRVKCVKLPVDQWRL